MKINLPRALIALLIAACTACAHAVGFQHLIAPDPDGAPLEVGIWYPSAAVPASSSHDGSKDPRIKAAVVAAPALGFAFAPDGLKNVTVPVQLWRAEEDAILPHPWYAEAVRLALPQPPEYHVVPKAGHFDFLHPCSEAFAARAPDICNSAPGFDRAAFHVMFNTSALAFFDKALKH
ncbi:alpha/beta hydrolase family protein [Collimonas silvisoli]|uniref:alpha/beta hydrolase family protein n=1 Tax=Collimonas silvisoli TaxID=2825884 RepID=UPI001B8B65F3|nr:hypothetical protein [Collimonas silvisoli]